MSVTITKTERGFHVYGEPIIDIQGRTVRVYESSAATAPHVWLSVESEVSHLNEDQARELIARLQSWLNEIPERWNLDALEYDTLLVDG